VLISCTPLVPRASFDFLVAVQLVVLSARPIRARHGTILSNLDTIITDNLYGLHLRYHPGSTTHCVSLSNPSNPQSPHRLNSLPISLIQRKPSSVNTPSNPAQNSWLSLNDSTSSSCRSSSSCGKWYGQGVLVLKASHSLFRIVRFCLFYVGLWVDWLERLTSLRASSILRRGTRCCPK
jgi:hypothetical protein